MGNAVDSRSLLASSTLSSVMKTVKDFPVSFLKMLDKASLPKMRPKRLGLFMNNAKVLALIMELWKKPKMYM